MEKDNIDFKVKAKLVNVKRTKYLDWRYLTNNIPFIMRLVDDVRSRDIIAEQEERKNRPRSNEFFGSIIDGIGLLGKNLKAKNIMMVIKLVLMMLLNYASIIL